MFPPVDQRKPRKPQFLPWPLGAHFWSWPLGDVTTVSRRGLASLGVRGPRPGPRCDARVSCASQIYRCTGGITFSLLTAWLLGAYSADMHISTQRHSRGTKLRKLILSDELKPAAPPPDAHGAASSSPSHRRCHRRHNSSNTEAASSFSPGGPAPGWEGEGLVSPSRRTHQRSKSDATTASSGPGSGLRRTGSNPKGEAVHEEVRTEFFTPSAIFLLNAFYQPSRGVPVVHDDAKTRCLFCVYTFKLSK